MAKKKKKTTKKKSSSSSSRESQIASIKKQAESIQKSLNESVKSGSIKSGSSSSGGNSSSSKSKEDTAKELEATIKVAQSKGLDTSAAQKLLDEANKEIKNEKTKKDEKSDTSTSEKYDSSVLTGSEEYNALNDEDKQAVLAVFDAISSNDQVKAKRLAEAFKASSKMNDPYFAQQLRLATDAIERGYVAIDKEAEFAELQAKTRLEDVRKDYELRKDFMTLEEASVMKEIERSYTENLETLQQGLAEGGFGSSSRRIKKEAILDEATGDLRESKARGFAFERSGELDKLNRSERDTEREIARLKELTKEGKLDFLRKAEQQVGSDALRKLPLNGDPAPLGDIYGDIPEQKLRDTINSMTQFVF